MSCDTEFELQFKHKRKSYLESFRRYSREKEERWDKWCKMGGSAQALMRKLRLKKVNEVVSWGFDFSPIIKKRSEFILPATAFANQNTTNLPITGINGELADILAKYPELEITGTFTNEYDMSGIVSGYDQIDD